MKAAILVGPRRIEMRQVADPAVPDDGLVLDVRACGVCGSDLRRWKEGPPEGKADIVPGHEIAGVVRAVGPNLRGFSVGENLAVAPDVHCGRCYFCQRGLYNLCDNLRFIGIDAELGGGFAEQLALTADILTNGCVHRMPADMTFQEGALAEPVSSIVACHDKAGTSLNDTVVVMGGGPIGCLHIMVAKARGARVILSEPGKGRRTLAQRFGPAAVCDPFTEDLAARVRDLTEGVGADIVVCANPSAASQAQAVQVVRKGGRVVLFGGLPKANPLTMLDGNRIHYGEIMVVGAFSYHPMYHDQALDLIRLGVIDTGVITHTFPLPQVEQAFAMADGGVDALKVMVVQESS
jgi:L-iditol 2-dehydrogenase